MHWVFEGLISGGHTVQKIKQAGISNNAGSTLVKAISAQNDWAWVQPAENEIFKVTQDADLPTIVFEFKS